MEIVSWNVNGIRASWNHGLQSFLYESSADIYCFQETKASSEIQMLEIDGYYPYWSFCKGRRAYSGTLCLSRIEPLSVKYGVGNGYDTEGRVITLEYSEFYLINCYFPNSQHSNTRHDFRLEWDRVFTEYIGRLRLKKPVIICGDFNVALSTKDIYAESKWVEITSQGFQSDERENIEKLIELGFTDSYRYLHPDETEKFSWWSNRKYKRKENRGWRLDYFFTDNRLIDKIISSEILNEVRGSDHCPITLNIDLSGAELSGIKRNEPHRTRYCFSDLVYMGQYEFLKKNEKVDMSNIWETINWEKAEENLKNMQEALAKSAYSREISLIEKWQKKIVFSLDAKILAVKHVYEAATTSGIDEIRWETSHEKMAAALSLTSKDYKAMPTRMLIIKCKNGKERRIHIETFYDRAMQTLYAYALDPIAESWADKKSFAFRKGRSANDVNEYIKLAFSGENAPEWAFVGDIKQCYENISHEWIMSHIPMQEGVLSEFLEAGYVVSGNLFPMDKGVGIGCSISPIIANMVLDGLEEYIFNKVHDKDKKLLSYDELIAMDFTEGDCIRYADDIIVTARTKEGAEKIKEWVREFLGQRGLDLSIEKSHIININEGFDFLSRTYIKKSNRIYVYPSQKSIERFKNSIRETIENYSGSQRTLIEKINKKIDGWVSYHKIEEAEDAFRELDVYIKAHLLELCKRKHSKWDIQKILDKYWYMNHNGVYCYTLPENKEIRIKFLSDTITIKHYAVKTTTNPYIDFEYYEKKNENRDIQHVTGKYRSVWNRQNGCCYYCGKNILKDQRKEVIPVAFGRKSVNKIAYVHERCMYGSIDFIEAEGLPDTAEETIMLLNSLDKEQHEVQRKYLKPYNYFHSSTSEVIKLKFNQIEEIIECNLCKTARERTEYWYRRGFGTISNCWLDNNYKIDTLDLQKERIVFRFSSTSKRVINVEIPDEIANSRIPIEAKYEIENFYKYIIKKYGL